MSAVVPYLMKQSHGEKLRAERLSSMLRRAIPSVFCRVNEDCLLFDMRTLADSELQDLKQQIETVFSQAATA